MKFTNLKRKGLIIGGLCIALSAAGITFALLSSSSQTNENEFKGGYAKVNIAVMEKGKQHEDYTNKDEQYPTININEIQEKEVKIKNVNDPDYPTTDSYIRVKFVSQLIDQDGNTVGKGVKVKLNLNENSEYWVYDSKNDVYYYTEALAPGKETEVLLKSVTLEEKIDENQKLQVNVLADAISAHPEKNLEDAWNLSKENGHYFEKFSNINEVK